MAVAASAHDTKLGTGVSGLDTLLRGGLSTGGVYLIVGRPGTGKTIFANQICFAHARRGHRAMYVTLLGESHSRMLRNLRDMAFFDAAAVGSQITYVSAYRALRDRKLGGLLALVRKIIHDERPSLLVLDGLATLHAVGDPTIALKEFVAELHVLADLARCTLLVLANPDATPMTGPAQSMVDGIIELSFESSNARLVREIEVVKFRGGAHLLGRHEMEITSRGLVVSPRTELVMPPAPAASPSTDGARVSTGVAALDRMLDGGLLPATATMLLGDSGAGKTLLSLYFLDAGARREEQVLYLGFAETPEHLLQTSDNIKLPLREHVAAGRAEILWEPAVRFAIDGLAARLLEVVRRRDVRRVVIDGIDAFRQGASHVRRIPRFLATVIHTLRSLAVTVMFTDDRGRREAVRTHRLAPLADNIILLDIVDETTTQRRRVSIIKQRGSDHDRTARDLQIDGRGLRIDSGS